MSIHPAKLLLGILTPFVMAGSAWLTAAAAKYGIHLDPSGVNAFGIAGATAGTAVMVKLIHDVETNPKVEKVIHEVERTVAPEIKAVEVADPAVRAQATDLLAQVERTVEAKFGELVKQLPKPAPVAAPVVGTPVPPAA